MLPQNKTVTRSRASRNTFLVALGIAFAMTFVMVYPYLLALAMGAILALLVRPLFRKLKSRGMRPAIAAFLVTTAAALVILGPVLGFAAIAIDQGVDFAGWISSPDFTVSSLNEKLQNVKPLKMIWGDATSMEAKLRELIQNLGKAASAIALGVAAKLPSLAVELILAHVACFFFIVDGTRLNHWLSKRVPLDPDVRRSIFNTFKDTARSTLWAGITASTAQAIVIFTAFTALNVPASFLAGLATFFMAWIPIISCGPVWILAALYLVGKGFTTKAIIMVGFGLLASFVDNVIRPWVLKGRSNIHPLIGLLSVFGGMHVFGILGVLIGPIVAAVLISLLEVWPKLQKRYEEAREEATAVGLPAPA